MNKSLMISIPAAALVAIGLSTQVSLAQSAPTLTDDAATPAKPHCVVIPEQPVECFATEAEAMQAGTGENINRTPDQTPDSLNRTAARRPWRATLYEHANYNAGRVGLANYIFGSCGSRANIPPAFNDKTSSLRVGYCGITLYEHANLKGEKRYFSPGRNIPYVGNGFNDKASSFSLPNRR
jgi:hypothetical protein